MLAQQDFLQRKRAKCQLQWAASGEVSFADAANEVEEVAKPALGKMSVGARMRFRKKYFIGSRTQRPHKGEKRMDYPDLVASRQRIEKLILEHNIHGALVATADPIWMTKSNTKPSKVLHPAR